MNTTSMPPRVLAVVIAALIAELLLMPLLAGQLIKHMTPLLRNKCLHELRQ